MGSLGIDSYLTQFDINFGMNLRIIMIGKHNTIVLNSLDQPEMVQILLFYKATVQ